jgi:phosphoglycerate dehydrogenase-like enzyme
LFATFDAVTLRDKRSERSPGPMAARELGLMRPSAFLVKISRGPIVARVALLAAQDAGHIAVAGLDVYNEEPSPAGNPLRSAPRIVLAPHLGYVTDDGYRMSYSDAVEDIATCASGPPADDPT